MARIFFADDPAYTARIYLFPGAGNTDVCDKPLIVADAFDPGDGRGAREIANSPRYLNLLNSNHPNCPRAKGQDLIFVNFSQGAGFGFLAQMDKFNAALGQRQACGQFTGPAWFPTAATYTVGGSSLQSPTLMDNGSASFQCRPPAASATFDWKVSSESGYDWLEFYVDGQLKDRISGEIDWTSRAYGLPAGSHLLMWQYVKDYSLSAGQDHGWWTRSGSSEGAVRTAPRLPDVLGDEGEAPHIGGKGGGFLHGRSGLPEHAVGLPVIMTGMGDAGQDGEGD